MVRQQVLASVADWNAHGYAYGQGKRQVNCSDFGLLREIDGLGLLDMLGKWFYSFGFLKKERKGFWIYLSFGTWKGTTQGDQVTKTSGSRRIHWFYLSHGDTSQLCSMSRVYPCSSAHPYERTPYVQYSLSYNGYDNYLVHRYGLRNSETLLISLQNQSCVMYDSYATSRHYSQQWQYVVDCRHCNRRQSSRSYSRRESCISARGSSQSSVSSRFVIFDPFDEHVYHFGTVTSLPWTSLIGHRQLSVQPRCGWNLVIGICMHKSETFYLGFLYGGNDCSNAEPRLGIYRRPYCKG